MHGKAEKDGARPTGKPAPLADRPRELEDWLNYHLYHPWARKLAMWLAGTSITPNMVSIAGGGLVILAAVAYSSQAGLIAVLLGLFLHMGWHVLDGADGDLARLTGRSSSSGEVVDGICDYAGHIILYIALGALLQGQIGPFAWVLMLMAGIGRIVQTIHYEVQRRQYQWWVYGTPWLRSAQVEGGVGSGTIGRLGSGYLRLARWLAPNAGEVDALVSRTGGEAQARLRAKIRAESAPVLRGLPLLGSNYRTLALGASMFAGSPLYYFIYEASLLLGVLFRSIHTCRIATQRIIDQAPASTLR